MKRITCVVFLALISAASHSQMLTQPVNISQQSGAERQQILRTAPNGDLLISWIKTTPLGGDVHFIRSTDGGLTWMHPVKVTNNAVVIADFQRGAEFAVDTKMRIHMCWMENRVNKQPDIWYTRSEDTGKTWTAPISVSADSGLYVQDFPSIAVDSDDRVYISFLDSRERVKGESPYEQLYLTRSTDYGMTWSPSKRITYYKGGIGGTCECCKQDIVAGKNGTVMVAYRSNIENRRDMFVVRSSDAGESFQEPVCMQTDPWHIYACPVSGPNAALDADGTIHISWRDARDVIGQPRIWYARLDAGTDSVTENIMLSDASIQNPNNPDISVLQTGHVCILYQSFLRGIQYRIITPDKSIIAKELGDHGSTQQCPQIALSADGVRYLAWQDDISGSNEIWFARDTGTLPMSSVRIDDVFSDISVYPNPVRSGEIITVHGADQAVILDQLGREVFRSTTSEFRMPELPAGMYYVMTVNGSVHPQKLLILK